MEIPPFPMIEKLAFDVKLLNVKENGFCEIVGGKWKDSTRFELRIFEF